MSELTELFAFLDEHRGRQSTSYLVWEWLRKRASGELRGGITTDLLEELAEQRGLLDVAEYLTEEEISELLCNLSTVTRANSILDPTCGSGATLANAREKHNASIIHGCELNSEVAAIARTLLGPEADISEGDVLRVQENLEAEYDLIICQPPLGVPASDPSLVPGLERIRRAELGHALAVWSTTRLSTRGIAVLIVTAQFVWGQTATKLHKAINANRYRIRALIHIPGGSMTHIQAQSYALVLEPGEQKKVFIGQFAKDEKHQEQLVSNYRRKRSGTRPSLGRLCELEEFRGFEAFEASERLRRLARTAGWEKLSASSAIVNHEIVRKNREMNLEDAPNSLYVRLVGRGTAALVPHFIKGRSTTSEQVHLQVNEELVDPRFLVEWFNKSQVGRATLKSVNTGAHIPRIHVPSLLSADFYLPTLDEQRQTIDGARHLDRIRAEADEMESLLWDGAGEITDVVQAIKTINKDDRYDDWIESLPFPLASILWRHRAGGGSTREQYEVLLHFFEATAAFLATIHLSAFMSLEPQWQQHGARLVTKLSEEGLSLTRVSFGAWKLIFEYLSSVCGKLLGREEEGELAQVMYQTQNERTLEMLSLPDLRSILQRANQIRNDYSGHPGAIGEQQALDIHGELEELVQKIRGAFGRRWSSYELIQPGAARYSSGKYQVKARRLMGTRSAPFEQISVESAIPLESDELYLFDTASQTGLRLRPFVKVIPSPRQKATACFIYSRHTGTMSRFISYHFAEESEIEEEYADVDETLALFKSVAEAGT